MKRKQLTERQKEVLDYIIKFVKEQHQFPTRKNICEEFSFTQNAATCHIIALEKKKYLSRNLNNNFMISK